MVDGEKTYATHITNGESVFLTQGTATNMRNDE